MLFYSVTHLVTPFLLKVNLSLFNEAPRHEDVWWCGVIAPRIINLGSRWRWIVSFMSGKETPVPTGEEVGWTSDPVWKWRRRKSPCPCGESILGRTVRSLVTILTELSRVLFSSHGSLKYSLYMLCCRPGLILSHLWQDYPFSENYQVAPDETTLH
jgi:hypothetical protein